MLKTSDEILLLGSFNLIITEILFYLDTYLWQYSQLFRFETVIYIVQAACLIYLLCLIFVDLKIFRYLTKGNSILAYYLKSIGWIPYIYILGFFIYMWQLRKNDVSYIENLFSNYHISLILIAISLVIAWIRKHPRFLVE